jgi:radical SAM protein with 4Fe4S-binding SPASM domain
VEGAGHPAGMASLSRGCMGGVSFAFISHIGEVQICGFLPIKCGDVREGGFVKVWDESDVFNKLRDYSNIVGKCGACEFISVCGGCRARAYAISGDFLGEEPYCSYIPRGWEKP